MDNAHELSQSIRQLNHAIETLQREVTIAKDSLERSIDSHKNAMTHCKAMLEIDLGSIKDRLRELPGATFSLQPSFRLQVLEERARRLGRPFFPFVFSDLMAFVGAFILGMFAGTIIVFTAQNLRRTSAAYQTSSSVNSRPETRPAQMVSLKTARNAGIDAPVI